MNYDSIQAAIKLLLEATEELQNMLNTTPSDSASDRIVDFAKETVKKAIAEMSAAVNPPIISHLPPEFLAKAEKLGIPLDDLEVRVAISEHHPSQVVAILEEIENKAESIKRRREYFLIRLPEMRIEKLGPIVPVVSAADFKFPSTPIPKEFREEIKAKYNIDGLMEKRSPSRSSLFEKIKQAEQVTGFAPNEVKNSLEDDGEIMF